MPGTGRRKEDAHLREIERLTREFLKFYKTHPPWRFAPITVKFAEHVTPVVEQLDTVRTERGKRTPGTG